MPHLITSKPTAHTFVLRRFVLTDLKAFEFIGT